MAAVAHLLLLVVRQGLNACRSLLLSGVFFR
jgi:hypothetical protein